MRHLTAWEASLLIVLNLSDYQKENSSKANKANLQRFKLSASGITRMSGRTRPDHRFLDKVVNCMADLGWLMFEESEGYYGFLRIRVAGNWTRIGIKARDPSGDYARRRKQLVELARKTSHKSQEESLAIQGDIYQELLGLELVDDYAFEE